MFSRQLLLFLLLTCSSLAVSAQEVRSVDPERFTSPYDIEILIFERFGQGGTEHWPEDPGTPDLGLAVGDLSRAELYGPEAIPLPAEQEQFGPSAYTLERKGAVVHAHRLWRQDLRERNSPTWYRIGDGRLDGLLRITRGRFLHLETDLLLQPADSPTPYRVQLHRRMRSGETHYVDHPMLGILIRAEPVEVATAPEESAVQPATPVTSPAASEPTEQENSSEEPSSLPRAMPDPT